MQQLHFKVWQDTIFQCTLIASFADYDQALAYATLKGACHVQIPLTIAGIKAIYGDNGQPQCYV